MESPKRIEISKLMHENLKFLRKKNLLIRSMWFISFILSSIACGWLTIKMLFNYFEYETVSKINIKQVSQLIFPVVTICNLSPFRSIFLNTSLQNFLDYKDYFNALNEFKHRFDEQTDFKDEINVVNVSDFIISCTFNFQSCDLDNDFERFYDYHYGVCFRFNSGRSMNRSRVNQKYTVRNGLYYGLNLELYTIRASQNNNLFSFENGFNIFISNYSNFDSNQHEGISISNGFSTRIIISQTKTTKIVDCMNDLYSVNSY